MKLKNLFVKLAASAMAIAIGGAVVLTTQKEAKPVNAAAVNFTEITSTAGIVSGNSYLITSNFNGATGVEYYPVVTGGALAAGGVAAGLKTAVDSTTKLLTFTGSTSAYAISDGTNFLKASTANNGISMGSVTENWALAYVTGKGFTLLSATTRYLTLYSNSNWRCYGPLNDYGATQNGYLHIYSVALAAAIPPTSIAFDSYGTTLTSGNTMNLCARMSPSTTNETVVWSSNPTGIVVITTNGTTGGVDTATLTPINNGTVVVTATASTTTSINVSTDTITVSGFSTDIAPKTYSTAVLGITESAYPSSTVYANADGVSIAYEKVLKASDYVVKSSSVVISTTYESGALQMQSSLGYIYNATKYSAKVQDILVSCISSSAPAITIAGGASSKVVDVSATGEVLNGLIRKYTFASPVDFFTIHATGTAYFNSFTVEMVGGLETTASLAGYINGLIPNRADATGLCQGTSGNYVVSKTRFLAASSEVQADFQTSSVEAVVAARARFVQWCSVVGDGDPFGSTIVSPEINLVLSDSTGLETATLCIVLFSLAIGGLALLRRKKSVNA